MESIFKSPEVANFVAPFYCDVRDALDPILEQARHDSRMATEGLNSNILGRFFVKLTDTMIGLLNTFRTNAFKSLKTLKRSEMREFLESNRSKTFTVNRMDYAKVQGYPVDVPANMSSTYKTAIAQLEQLYLKLNALPVARVAYQSLTEVSNIITTNAAQMAGPLSHAMVVTQEALRVAQPLVIELQKSFAGPMVGRKPFKDVYKDMTELKFCQEKLVMLEPRLQEVRAITELIEDLEQVFANLTRIAQGMQPEESQAIQQKDLDNLASIAKSLALMFDAYGMASTRQMSLEHNIVLNINDLYDHVR